MLKFLTGRPIAVLMSVLAISVLGIIAFLNMPVSLLPDIDIPLIKVRVNYQKTDARELENSIVKPLRRQLMQVAGLTDINSVTNDGKAEIQLHFSHSVNTEYAFIEVNEKIDAALNTFPRDMERPRVIKSKPSDIAVFYISIVPDKSFYEANNTFDMLSEYCEMIVKRRLEQLPEVSMVDISGLTQQEITIKPLNDKLSSLGLKVKDLEKAITKSHQQPSNLSFRDGYYVYRLRIQSNIKTIDDIGRIKLSKNGKLFPLSELSEISLSTKPGDGMFYHNGKRAISMAVYKQTDARMQDIKSRVNETINDLKKLRPDLSFSIDRDQTELLEYSLNNLKQTLALGILLAMLILFIFIRQPKLPLIISISIPVSLVISFFFLNLFGISLNIISLSGLILSVGLMIDNSIIVVDNINQYRFAGSNTFDATVAGTNEVIRPLISSVLTTCAVFLPMISLSGIAGAIFYEQGITISISLLVSLLVSIMVIPVLYNLIMGTSKIQANINKGLINNYEKLLAKFMANKKTVLFAFFMLIPLTYIMFIFVEKEKFPAFQQTDSMVFIDWNEPINLDENKKRSLELISDLKLKQKSFSAYIGDDLFILNDKQRQDKNTSTLYINFDSIINISALKREISSVLKNRYPQAVVDLYPSENIFQSVFSPKGEPLKAIIRNSKSDALEDEFGMRINETIDQSPEYQFTKIPLNKTEYDIYLNRDNILLYDLNINQIISKLKLIFGGHEIDKLQSGNKVLSILMREEAKNPVEMLSSTTVTNKDGAEIPLNSLISFKLHNKLENIKADDKGEYFNLSPLKETEITNFENSLRGFFASIDDIDISFKGSLYEQEILFAEFLKVMLISFVLLYLILAAQFESLVLPLIILIEIAFDISGALLFLILFGSSLNIMSAIGMIVMAGIVINDSIIKIDTIKKSYEMGMSLTESVYEGGRRRFYPIVMTSLTTILALFPLVFFSGMGVELQLPLALAIIGGLGLGTIISLYFIPLMFYVLTRKSKK
jgi:multidrug efflux pump subunit AcrB